MKKLFTLGIALLISLSVMVACSGDDTPINNGQDNKIYTQLKLSDPSFLYENGTYYLYGIGNAEASLLNSGIPVYTSKDLIHWDMKGFALSQKNTANQSSFNCPEVYKINNEYYMYYAAGMNTYLAKSSSPVGPFIQTSSKVVVPNSSIDACMFEDNGTYYLFYAQDGLIKVAKMNSSLTAIVPTTARTCITMTDSWERVGGGFFGPQVIKENGKLYLFYTTNAEMSKDCAIGVASADKVMGVWTKSADNPILHRPNDLVGIANCGFIKDNTGTLKMAFSAHYSQTKIYPWRAFITDCSFENGNFTINKSNIVKLLISSVNKGDINVWK